MPDRRYTYQVDIDVAQARRAAQQLRGIFEGELRTINTGSGGSATGTVRGVGSGASSMLGGMGGMLGASLAGLGAGVTAGRILGFAKELNELNRQARMAEQGLVQLAGSAEEAAARTALVQEATGGTISKIEAMQQAMQLSALGFADTTAEMERFIRASQGASAATGRTVDYITQQLVLAISNQSLMRLDQLGLGVSEVKQRIEELKVANADWSKEMLYQEAVLGALEQKYGVLADTVKENASGLAQLSAAWTDYKTAVSGAGTSVDTTTKAAAGLIERLTLSNQALSAANESMKTSSPLIRQLAFDLQFTTQWFVLGAAGADELTASLERLKTASDAYSAAPYYPTREDEPGATGPRRTHPDYVRPGFLGDPIARPHVPRESYADRQAAEQKAYLDRWEQILAQDSWEKWENDKRLAEQAGREWSSAADTAADAWEDAARKFKEKLERVPGLFGTSDTTGEQMALADMGVPQEFADNYLRRLRDEVLNGVDWAGVDLGEASRLAGIDQGLPPEAQLAMFEQAWQDSSLFANPEALRLIDQDAVRAGIERQERSEQGRANLLKLFGADDPDTLAGVGADIGAGVRPGIVQGMSGEEGGGSLVMTLGTEMQSSLSQDSTTQMFMGVGVSVIGLIRAGFEDSASRASWLGPIADAITAEVLSIINEGQEDGEP